MRSSQQPISIVGLLFGVSITFWASNLAAYISKSVPQPTQEVPLILPRLSHLLSPPGITFGITLVSGALFLIDILCVLWWFARYIYRIQPAGTLWTHFLDFSVVGMFNLAASKWDNAVIFLTASLSASLLLLWRFYWLYKDPDATDTDRQILKRARWGLIVALVIVGLAVLAITEIWKVPRGTPNFKKYILPALPGTLSAIGICLTLWLKDSIAIAVDIHEMSNRRFIPMDLHWPSKLLVDTDAKERIRQNTADGLETFHDLFRGQPGELSHERVRSRVHPEADLRIQSYILSMTSWKQEQQREIKAKAFMVGVSHWLDDLFDGRNEVALFRTLKKLGDYGLDTDNSEAMFKKIYRDVIVQHTDHKFFENLVNQIKGAAGLPPNQQCLFWGLNRVAIGSVIFGPRVHEQERKAILDRHNAKLQSLITRNNDEWSRKFNRLLDDMQSRDVGRILLGLTTKTVQEIAMASEGQSVNFGLSLLYGLLYAPLLYFHDLDGELECREMVPLDTFDVNYDVVIPWLRGCRQLCQDTRLNDERNEDRLHQLEMAFRCFERKLSQSVSETLREIYVPRDRETVPFPAELARPATEN